MKHNREKLIRIIAGLAITPLILMPQRSIACADILKKNRDPIWSSLKDESKVMILGGDLDAPKGLKVTEYKELKDLDRVTEKFVSKIIHFLDTKSLPYNPNFPFLLNREPLFASIKICTNTKTGEILGGYVYMVRDLAGDAGSAWINGYFDSTVRYLGRGIDYDPDLVWSHY